MRPLVLPFSSSSAFVTRASGLRVGFLTVSFMALQATKGDENRSSVGLQAYTRERQLAPVTRAGGLPLDVKRSIEFSIAYVAFSTVPLPLAPALATTPMSSSTFPFAFHHGHRGQSSPETSARPRPPQSEAAPMPLPPPRAVSGRQRIRPIPQRSFKSLRSSLRSNSASQRLCGETAVSNFEDLPL
jgi:hypothetical protein